MDEERLAVYHNRAVQLADAMKLCQDDLAAYSGAAALLAVHSGISYGDAVLIRLAGRRPKPEDHRRVVLALAKACNVAGVDRRGVAHLDRLISAKTDISYGDKLIDTDRIARLCVYADRFQVWAERVLARRRVT